MFFKQLNIKGDEEKSTLLHFTENPVAENGQSYVTAEHGLGAAYRGFYYLRLRRVRP
jgi:hypothetical protein